MSSIIEDVNRFCLQLSNGSNISIIDNPVHHISVGVFPNEVFLGSFFWLFNSLLNCNLYLIKINQINGKTMFCSLTLYMIKLLSHYLRCRYNWLFTEHSQFLFNNFKWITMQIYFGYFKRTIWWCIHKRSMERADRISG